MVQFTYTTPACIAGVAELERCAKTLQWLGEHHKQLQTSKKANLVQPRHYDEISAASCGPASEHDAQQSLLLHAGDLERISQAAAEGM
jgi:hypothetical protein